MRKYFYVIDFENYGGLVMPLIFELKFTNGKSKIYSIPAEIWRRNNEKVSKLVITDHEVVAVVLDPRLETADIDLSNNHFPPKMVKSRFQMFKSSGMRFGSGFNPMRQAQMEERMKAARKKAEKEKAEKEKAEQKKKKETPKKNLASNPSENPRAAQPKTEVLEKPVVANSTIRITRAKDADSSKVKKTESAEKKPKGKKKTKKNKRDRKRNR